MYTTAATPMDAAAGASIYDRYAALAPMAGKQKVFDLWYKFKLGFSFQVLLTLKMPLLLRN